MSGTPRAPLVNTMALDRDSVRTYDADGHLHVARANISKAIVNPYNGSEIPGYAELGLDPQRVYMLLRDPEELKRGAATFDGKPLMFVHTPVDANDHAFNDVVGAVMNAAYEHPFLTAELVIWPGAAIKAIEAGNKQQLSCGYRYRPVMEPGVHEDVPYDGRMTEIIGNHVALVTEGRAGPDVIIGDSALPPAKGKIEMKNPALSSKAKATAGALHILLKPMMASDAKLDLAPILAKVTHKNFGDHKARIASDLRAALAGKLAADAKMDSIEKCLDDMEDMDTEAMDTEANAGLPAFGKNKVEDEEEETASEKAERLAKRAKDKKTRDKKAADAEAAAKKAEGEDEDLETGEKEDAEKAKDEEKDKDMVTKPAMDAAIAAAITQTKKTASDLRAAEMAVRPYVGELAMAHDSAEGVYRSAFKLLNVPVGPEVPASAFPTILSLIPVPGAAPKREPNIGMDAATVGSFDKMFPEAGRISHV